MIQDENAKLRLIAWVFPLLLLIVSISEMSILPLKEYYFYYLGKSFFAITVSALCLLLLKVRLDLVTIFIGIFAFSYSAFCQLYRPLYFISFVQVACFYPLFVPVKQKNFLIAISVGSIIFILSFLYSFEINPLSFQSISKSDIITTVITTAILGLVLNKTLDKNRIFYGEALERFSIIGEVSTAIAHNIKGMVSSPLLEIEILEKKLKQKENFEAAERLSDIHQNIENIERVLRDMNYISHVAHEKNEWVSLNDIITNASRILDLKRKNVELSLSDDISIYTDQRHLEALVIGLLLNSLKSFERAKVSNGQVLVNIEKNKITFKDNGDGFQEKILTSLNKGEYLYHDGFSGLGLTLTRRTIQRLGGSIYFSNDNGAVVDIRLPKKIIQYS